MYSGLQSFILTTRLYYVLNVCHWKLDCFKSHNKRGKKAPNILLFVAEWGGGREERILYNNLDTAVRLDSITVSELAKRGEKRAFCKGGLTGNVVFE